MLAGGGVLIQSGYVFGNLNKWVARGIAFIMYVAAAGIMDYI